MQQVLREQNATCELMRVLAIRLLSQDQRTIAVCV